MTTLPLVSIVMTTFNRRSLLERSLRAIAEMDWPRDRLETIVVNNGSTDETAEWLESNQVPTDVTVVTIEQNVPPAIARNRALAVACGAVIAFTDDDCRPTSSWLHELLSALTPDIGIAQGLTRPDPAQSVGPLSRSQWTLSEQGLYETCNIAYRRSALDLEGAAPFSTRMPDAIRRLLGRGLAVSAFGEDTELAWRVKRHGVRSVFVEDAVVHHNVYDGDLGYVVRRSLLAAGFPALVKACPELRRTMLWGGVFLSRRHALGWLATVGLVAMIVHPGLGLAAVPYLWLAFEPGRRRGWRTTWRVGVARIIRDVLEGWSALYGSLRTGRLVL